MAVTIQDLQKKVTEKIEQKHKSGVTRPNLTKFFDNVDRDNDGQVSLVEFDEALKVSCGNPLSDQEVAFLFRFYDGMAGGRPETGYVEVDLVVQDLLSSMPQYDTGFNSGAEHLKTNKGAKGNLPSQAGGIFGGGSYEADSRNELPIRDPRAPTGAAPPYSMGMPGAPSERPKGNQSSIPGGIFGANEQAPPPSANNGGRSNRSNKSSIEGGIFGAAAPVAAPSKARCNSNASSIPGGIFG